MPIKRRPPQEKKLKRLLPINKPTKPEAIKTSKAPRPNTGTRAKTKRTTYESTEESKPTVASTIERDTKDGQHPASCKEKPQMRAEKSSSNMSKMLLTLLKLKILKKILEPPKLPRWTLKTSRILSMRKPESDPAELP